MAVRRRHDRGTHPTLKTTDHYLGEMERIIRTLSYRHSVYSIFQDFTEMSAIALSNAVDLSRRPAREERYIQMIQRYTKEEMRQFPQLLGLLTDALEYQLGDVLGVLYHRLDIHDQESGQFFTPYPVCLAMAKMLVHDAKSLVDAHGFLRASEPCVGSGAMVIALAEACRDQGVNYQRQIHVTAVDIAPTAVFMAYVQLFLLHIPAVVIHGDTLRLQEHDQWCTAAHILDLWQRKLQRTKDEAVIADTSIVPQAIVAPNVPLPLVPLNPQLTLF